MRIIAFFSLFLFASLPAFAQTHTFGGVGTRAEGMGGAFVAVADDVSAVYWNPAGIATGATFDFQISTGRESTLFVGAALPVLGASYYRTSQAAGFTTVSVPPDRQNGGSGEVHIGTFTTSNYGATVVQTIVPAVVVGTTVRAVSAGIDGADFGTTVDFDAGAIVSVEVRRGEKSVPNDGGTTGFQEGGSAAALSGFTGQSAKGVARASSIQMLFYVPGVGSTGDASKIELLGWSESLVSASEVK